MIIPSQRERVSNATYISAIRPYEFPRINTSWLGYGCGFCDGVTVHGVVMVVVKRLWLARRFAATTAVNRWCVVNGAGRLGLRRRIPCRRLDLRHSAQPGHRRRNRGDAREAHRTKVSR